MYERKEFDKCLFNPCEVDMFVSYPQLIDLQKISENIDNKLIKYIVCVYDYRSPVVVNNRELKVRKQVAADFAGYDVLNSDLKYLYNIEPDYMLQAIDYFLKTFIHSRVWYMICCNEHIFWEYGQRMLKPVTNKGEDGKPMTEKAITEAMALKTDLSKDMSDIDERLDAAYKRLYGDERADRFINAATTPERVATERAKK